MGGIRHHRPRQPRKNKGWQQDSRGQRGGYKDIVRENKLFEEYYRQQEICQTKQEFQEMMDFLRKDLPASFRVTGFRSQATAVRNLIEFKYMSELADVQAGGGDDVIKVEPKCLPWYPDRMAWQLNLTRKDIRRVEAYFKLHNFLISETESGNVSRQETVSMIPPLVLDVKSHHKVLDMCAAPGSKTVQILEALHADENILPTGLVVANDSDNSRCYLLVHQIKRLQSPNYIIINEDASILPNIQLPAPNDSDRMTHLKFDRILCDVPCSGDGTLRKNADIWPKWNGANSCNLHGIQYRIAKRGLELLEIGGRMVYSTCSLNPLEDEAVINRLLTESGDAVELVDVSADLPGLKFKPGLKKWKLAAKDNKFFSSWEEVPENHKSLMRPFMFPPEEDKINLERCIRILPHQQDTGGFFVAVLHKRDYCKWEKRPEADDPIVEQNQNALDKTGNDSSKRKNSVNDKLEGGKSSRKRGRFQGYREDPFVYFDKEKTDAVFTHLKDYFDLKLDQSLFFTRSRDTSNKNNIYFSTPLIRDIVENNVDRIKIVNTGVKSFTKCENFGATCEFRLAQEGAQMTIPFLGSKIVKPSLRDLEKLLQRHDTDMPMALGDLDAHTQGQCSNLRTGSIALIYEGKSEDGLDLKLELVGWKGKNSLRAYVEKNERVHFLRLLGADTSMYEVNKFQLKRENEKKEETPEQVVREDETQEKPMPQTVQDIDMKDEPSRPTDC